jgi:two-component system, chemotaxis family, sensor kinase CheA
MGNSYIDEPMIEAYVYETSQIVETLENIMITSEKTGTFNEESINEIFRFMHTIKGSSAMMMFNDISTLAHRLEDIFYVIREEDNVKYDFTRLIDLILESIDYFKIELMKIKAGDNPDGDQTELLAKLSAFHDKIKKNKKKSVKPQETMTQKYYISPSKKESDSRYYQARLWFKENSEMENIRSFTVVHNIGDLVEEVRYQPRDIIENDDTIEVIRKHGFLMNIKTTCEEHKIKEYLESTIFLEKLEFDSITSNLYDEFSLLPSQNEQTDEIKVPKTSKKYVEKKESREVQDASGSSKQSIISVNVDKLDKLMDMVGELVIAEAMVTQNPEVKKLEIDSFDKASRQLRKITSELQDLVMAIRMVSLSTTFMKMHRIVRDMSKKLDKKIELHVHGEETEVDKNIIEKIADPLMHIIRNSIDHGIEDEEERKRKGKEEQGNIVLEAKNSGSDVLIIIRDDGKGLNKQKLYDKAIFHGLVSRAVEEMTDKEVYQLILHPGFSTKEEVTEFSGRGVGMDVVAKNIESVGGTVIVDSIPEKGTTIILKIPLTLAIIEGMNIKVGNSRFTLPIVSIKESFRPKNSEIIKDTEGMEMIMVRGLCYPIVRLNQMYDIPNAESMCEQGILIMVEDNERSCCIFADELLGQQQVVVKALPEYVKKHKQIKGIGGCTLLGDGSISLILDVGEFNLSNVNEKANV